MSEISLPSFSPLGDSQRELLAERVARVVALSALHGTLRDVLLSLGGLEIVFPRYDTFEEWQRYRDDWYTKAILARGRPWLGSAARLELGECNLCHQNVARLYVAGRGTIATGYALAEDGLWREHSWIIEGPAQDRVVETTATWLVYYGCVLDEERARWFARDELGEDAVPGEQAG